MRHRTRSAELYNLADDIGERRDLAAQHPDRVAALTAPLEEWLRLHIPPRFEGPR